MKQAEIRQKFIDFFKKRGHAVVPSSSLLPTDPSVLFTTAGMQQFKPYYTGAADAQKVFGSLNTVSIQKCIRTSDIDEVGDESHLTFFEMLGNFSFGGYWKEDALGMALTFLVDKKEGMGIDEKKIHVTYFAGDPELPGITVDIETKVILENNSWFKDKMRPSGKDNFWGPTGLEGPCGPTVEFYVDNIEIWNVVFNEFYKTKDGKYIPQNEKRGIDTGMGLERLAKVAQNVPTVFETDLFAPIIDLLPDDLDARIKRIVADHTRAVAFLLTDGVRPSNKDQGYVLRRLMRRIIAHEHVYAKDLFHCERLFEKIAGIYGEQYPDLNADRVIEEFNKEKEKFIKTLHSGIKELNKLTTIDAAAAFRLYESFGLPYEVIKEMGGTKAEPLRREDFDAEFRHHQEKSRAGAEKKFGGHGLLLDTGELKAANQEELAKVTRLHTATHLLQAALRNVLGESVHQAGSDITAERTRFDFTFDRKLTAEELKKVEDSVNDAIGRDLPVTKQTLPQEEALKTGALHFFKTKYPPYVDVYTIGSPSADSTGSPRASSGSAFSREFCGGPHVTHTGGIGKFKIIKEEAVSAGVRRIRAIIQ